MHSRQNDSLDSTFPLGYERKKIRPQWWRVWWRRQSTTRQDRFAILAPVASVVLFLAAIAAAFSYLRLEEMEREHESLKRDVEQAQQQIRLRLQDSQDHLVRLSRELRTGDLAVTGFYAKAEGLTERFPEVQILTWVDSNGRVTASYVNGNFSSQQARATRSSLSPQDTKDAFLLAQDVQLPVYGKPRLQQGQIPLLELHVPMPHITPVNGALLAEYGIESILQLGVLSEVRTAYAVALLDKDGAVMAGNTAPKQPKAAQLLPWVTPINAYAIPIAPLGNGLTIKAQVWRTSVGVIGSGLFWLVCALSTLTVWMLFVTWRHTRRRMFVQQALLTETNFRRAMENSMPTGMRAMDLQGRITYVNAAFTTMTGWNEKELVGRTAPYPYWPDSDKAVLHARLADELAGRTPAGGFQVRIKKRDGTVFDARLYVSPLVDAKGVQTGWMTSITDITEPNRVRQQLSASYERFTTVLEALDAAVSVAPLGNNELLFANKMYQEWFGQSTEGHSLLVRQAGSASRTFGENALDQVLAEHVQSDTEDEVDGMVGMPADLVAAASEPALSETQAQSVEIYVPSIQRWLEVRARYLTWVDGRLAQMVIATNITPRRLAEESAAAQAERAQAASHLVTMGEMVSSVAHELNQPLTAINNYCSGMVSRIKSKQIDQEDLIAALEKTAKQSNRAGQIIQRIRSFVKRSEPNRTPSDVPTMVEEAIELAGIEMRRRSVRLNHYLAARLPKLNVDPILIEQVLVNLLKNAAESVDNANRPAGRRSVELRVLPKAIDGQPVVEFAVLDTGKGLAPEVMERLYEAFFSTKAEGMGIGLNLCRTIIESHQGRVQAENIYNGLEITGCRFSFWLPA